MDSKSFEHIVAKVEQTIYETCSARKCLNKAQYVVSFKLVRNNKIETAYKYFCIEHAQVFCEKHGVEEIDITTVSTVDQFIK